MSQEAAHEDSHPELRLQQGIALPCAHALMPSMPPAIQGLLNKKCIKIARV
jgi:hypothetical protein